MRVGQPSTPRRLIVENCTSRMQLLCGENDELYWTCSAMGDLFSSCVSNLSGEDVYSRLIVNCYLFLRMLMQDRGLTRKKCGIGMTYKV